MVDSLLIYPRLDRPHDRRYTHGRPVAVVQGLRVTGGRITSRTPLFVDDGHGTLFFTEKTYRSLACGPVTVLNLVGTARYGVGGDQRRHGMKPVYLAGTRIMVVVKRRTVHGRTSYDLRVVVPRLGYDRTTRGLQGTIARAPSL